MAEAAPDSQRRCRSAARGRNSVGWWGVLCLIATEASLFAYLLFSYFYIALQYGPAWLPERASLARPVGARHRGPALQQRRRLVGRGGRQDAAGAASIWRPRRSAIGLGALFVVVQVFEWKAKTVRPRQQLLRLALFHHHRLPYGARGRRPGRARAPSSAGRLLGYFNPRRHAPVSIGSAYWHFVDAVWLFVFFTFYLTPYLCGERHERAARHTTSRGGRAGRGSAARLGAGRPAGSPSWCSATASPAMPANRRWRAAPAARRLRLGRRALCCSASTWPAWPLASSAAGIALAGFAR